MNSPNFASYLMVDKELVSSESPKELFPRDLVLVPAPSTATDCPEMLQAAAE